MSDPTESPPAAPKRRPRRIFGIGAILLGVPILLWIGAGFFVARSLRYPDFLRRGGEDAFGQHVPQFKRGSITEVGNALGVEPERLDCGVVEEDGIAHHQVSVVGWYFPGKRREVVVIIPPAGAPETAMIPYVKFLLGAGYTVVAVIQRQRSPIRNQLGNAQAQIRAGDRAHADGRRLHQDSRARNLRGRGRRDHGAGRAAGLHRDRRRQFLRKPRAAVHAQPVDVRG